MRGEPGVHNAQLAHSLPPRGIMLELQDRTLKRKQREKKSVWVIRRTDGRTSGVRPQKGGQRTFRVRPPIFHAPTGRTVGPRNLAGSPAIAALAGEHKIL